MFDDEDDGADDHEDDESESSDEDTGSNKLRESLDRIESDDENEVA